jgi:hypothetical protein
MLISDNLLSPRSSAPYALFSPFSCGAGHEGRCTRARGREGKKRRGVRRLLLDSISDGWVVCPCFCPTAGGVLLAKGKRAPCGQRPPLLTMCNKKVLLDALVGETGETVGFLLLCRFSFQPSFRKGKKNQPTGTDSKGRLLTVGLSFQKLFTYT